MTEKTSQRNIKAEKYQEISGDLTIERDLVQNKIETKSYMENSGTFSGSGDNIINVENDFAKQTPESRQNLAEAAREIQDLLQQLEETYSTETTTSKMQMATETIDRIDKDPALAQRILRALGAGGTAALESLLDHPAASFAIGALEDWRNSKQQD